jgi:hypothetical protein
VVGGCTNSLERNRLTKVEGPRGPCSSLRRISHFKELYHLPVGVQIQKEELFFDEFLRSVQPIIRLI